MMGKAVVSMTSRGTTAMQKSLLLLKLFFYICVGASTISTASAYTVTIKSPVNGAAVASPVTVNAQVDSTTCNSGFQYLQVLVNGNLASRGTGNCSISASVNLPQSSDTLNVQAIRWDGALMAQSAITVTVPTATTAQKPGPSSALFASPYYRCLRNFYVATNGSDGNPGTQAQPFRSIALPQAVV